MADPAENLIQAMGLGDLLSMPLEALIEADAAAACATTEMIREYGFEREPDDPPDALGRLRMLRFSYDELDAEGERIRRFVEVPLITLMALPLLNIKDARLEFSVDIFGAMKTETAPLPTATRQARTAAPREERRTLLAQFSTAGPAAARTTATRASADLDLTVTLEQGDLPAGVSHLLRLGAEGALLGDPEPIEDDSETSARFRLDPEIDAVRLNPAKPEATLYFRLETASGRPQPEATVSIIQKRASRLIFDAKRLVTDAAGRGAIRLAARFEKGAKPAQEKFSLRYDLFLETGEYARFDRPLTVMLGG
jgi:hypothetical protein